MSSARSKICRQHGCSLTMRGGGTSQAGQAIGEGLQVDTSKYFNRLLEVNVDERWARVEPGIVLDELNAQLRPHGLRFAPDISTASRATIGGMMANNSSGARSRALRQDDRPRARAAVVLSDGSVVDFRPLSPRGRGRGVRARYAGGRAATATVLRLACTCSGRNRAALSEGHPPRRRLQPRRVRRSRRSRSIWPR